VFGSMVGWTAMSFTAVLVLQATPFQMGVLQAMELVPAFLIGLFAGAWADRLRRKPLMIGADLGRAVALGTIPLAFLAGVLGIFQLYLVALVVSILTIFFNVAYQSFLPTLVGKERLVEGNSKLAASAAVAEFSGFSLGGWLVQILTAPLAILIDAVSFVLSALFVWRIQAREPAIAAVSEPNMRGEIGEGLMLVFSHPLLRASVAVISLLGLSGGVFGALVVLYMSNSLGFSPGILGMIWAVGGVSSFVGAAFAPQLTTRLGSGPAMGAGLAIFGMSQLLIPLASGATLLSAVFIMVQQLGDGFYILYEINQVSLRQGIASENIQGRVSATMHFLNLGTTLVGSLLGGWLGGVLGLRFMLAAGACGTLLAAAVVWLSPLREYRSREENP
jgi:predicted MFS family arabinose efflux permease